MLFMIEKLDYSDLKIIRICTAFFESSKSDKLESCDF